jgi:hypothetical protein
VDRGYIQDTDFLLSIGAGPRAVERCGIEFALCAKGKPVNYLGTRPLMRCLHSESNAPWLP